MKTIPFHPFHALPVLRERHGNTPFGHGAKQVKSPRAPMRKHIGWTLPLLLLMGVIVTAAQAEQVCRDDIPATTPDSRFLDNGDGTVTDLATGLIWKQCAEGLSGADCASGQLETFTWQEALQQAEATVFAGSDLWRLPNVKELDSLVEQRCHGPAINAAYFPNTPSLWFRSSSPIADGSGYTWLVHFDFGYVNNSPYKNYPRYVRLVRAGQ